MATATWTYERRRERINEIRRQETASIQEIGQIPPVANPQRRKKAEQSYAYFCETYFPAAFTLPWSPCHKRAADKIERASVSGGLFAFAMPRGSGKTTMCEWAVLWAILTGQCGYVVLVGATEKAAEKRLRNIKVELQSNALLQEDWPEVCYPIEKLERSVRRAEGQKHNGEHTAIEWKKKQLVLPTVVLEKGEAYLSARAKPQRAPTSGSIIDVVGITGEVRGLNHKREDGSIARPQLAVCDDPQTRDSAKSLTQSQDREAVIAADVAYLAGPGKPISVVMPCTVVYQGDLADRLLDWEKHPEWQGERTKMLISFPSNRKLWDEYAEIQRDSYRGGGEGVEATEFYRTRREEMDAGAETYWPERYDAKELSSIQHAMNKFFRDEAAFFSEYQNEPINHATDAPELSDEEIASKINGVERGIVPAHHETLTAFIDISQDCLWYAVTAWDERFGGSVIDYGAWPDQGTSYFSLASVRHKLGDEINGGMEAAIFHGLTMLTNQLCGTYKREDGTEMRLSRLLIDAHWGQITDTAYQFCRETSHPVAPSHGQYVGASSQPWHERKKKRGERVGFHWLYGPAQGARAIRRVLIDTNHWKSFIHERLATPKGDPGCLTLFESRQHRMFAEQINAEFRVRTEGRGRKLDEWKPRPERPDNHFLDCLVGCGVAASMEGVSLPGQQAAVKQVTRKRYSDLNALRQQNRRT